MRIGELVLCIGLAASPMARAEDASPRLGTIPDAHTRATHDNLVFADGRGLPAGSGDIAQGARLFEAKCAACHGPSGRGGPGGELTGGNPDLTAEQPDRTIGTYWPYATTLFDFIRRAMPLDAPWSLTNDEVYALVAWLLDANGIAVPQGRLDAASLATIRMPNRDGFRGVDAAVN